jgi:hypothetical protein
MTTLFRYKSPKNDPTRFILIVTYPDLISGSFKTASGETRNIRFSELVAVPAAPKVEPKVTWEVTDYSDYPSGGQPCVLQVEDLHSDVSLHEIPDKLESVSVTVDNGRLGIYLDEKCVFYTASLNDGSVTITRIKKATK